MDSPLIHEWVYVHAARRPEAPAIATPRHRLTYGDLAERVRALAGHLGAAGVGPGARVLVALPNTPATVVASLAVQAAGATAVEVNREWAAEVQAAVVAQSGVRQAFVFGRDARTWGKVAAGGALERLWVVHGGPLPERMLADLGGVPAVGLREEGTVDPAAGAPPPPPAVSLPAEAVALILYTSGSTGRPRGVIQTFRNVAANTRSIVQYLGLTAADRAGLLLPVYYCYGRSVLQTHLLAGASVYLDDRFAFPRIVLEAFGAEGCTGFAGVPLTFELIRRQVDVATLAAAAPALPDPGRRGHGARDHRLGAQGLPPGAALRHVRPDRGHRPAHLPAAGAGGGEAGLDRHPHPRGGAAGGRRPGPPAPRRRDRPPGGPRRQRDARLPRRAGGDGGHPPRRLALDRRPGAARSPTASSSTRGGPRRS